MSPPPPNQFIARVDGESMTPRIPNGAICLFGPPSPPPYGDHIFLVAHPSIAADEAMGGPFAEKKLEVGRTSNGSRPIKLRSINRTYPPIAIDPRVADDVRVIAELVRIVLPLRGARA